MDKYEFEDLGIEIWVRLFQKKGQSFHERPEENDIKNDLKGDSR